MSLLLLLRPARSSVGSVVPPVIVGPTGAVGGGGGGWVNPRKRKTTKTLKEILVKYLDEGKTVTIDTELKALVEPIISDEVKKKKKRKKRFDDDELDLLLMLMFDDLL